MKINWFPGHMHKAFKDIGEQLKKVDVIAYVIDSRIPLSSFNPSLDKLAQNKPVLYILNKIDMADEMRVKTFLSKFQGENKDYVLFNSVASGKSEVILSKIKKLARTKIEKYKAKGVEATIRTMVVGIPNCGKSTLVNNLCKKAKTATGDRAGITKHGQWVNVGEGVEVYDTPGTLYPNIENQETARKLAYVGSVRDEILDFTELGTEFIKDVEKIYPDALKARYNFENIKNSDTEVYYQKLQSIAKARKFVLSGGELDLERTGKAVIEDFRKGRLGRLTLD